MSELADKINTALKAAPIKSLSDSTLRQELNALRELRAQLLAKALPPRPAPQAVAIATTAVPACPVVYKRVSLWKGSIFSRRVPVHPPTAQDFKEASQKRLAQAGRKSERELQVLMRTAAQAAGVPGAVFEAFMLRLKLVEAACASRTRQLGMPKGLPRGNRSYRTGRSKESAGAWVHPALRRSTGQASPSFAQASPDAPGSWVRFQLDRVSDRENR